MHALYARRALTAPVPSPRRPLGPARRVLFTGLVLLAFLALLEGGLQIAARLATPAAVPPTGPEDADCVLLGLGDSWMAGAEAEVGESFLAQTAVLAQERSGVACAVHNAGVPGTNSAQAYLTAVDQIPAVRPDVVLLITGVNDGHNLVAQAEVDARLDVEGEAAPAWARLRTARMLRLLLSNAGDAREVGESSLASGTSGGRFAGYDDPLTRAPWFALWRERAFAEGLERLAAEPATDEVRAWRSLFRVAAGGAAGERAALLTQVEEARGPARTLVLFALGLQDYREGRISRGSLFFSALVDEPSSWFRDAGLALWGVDAGAFSLMATVLSRALTEVPDSPEAWWAASLMSEEETPPAFLERLAALDGPRADRLIDLAQRRSMPDALALAGDEEAADELRAAALGLAVSGGADPAELAGLLEEFAGWPAPSLALLHRAQDRGAPCSERMALAESATDGGAFAQEVLSTLAGCGDGETLGAWEDEHRINELAGVERRWTDAVEQIELGRARPVDGSPRLDARIGAVARLAAESGATFVVVTYPFPSDQHRRVNARLAAAAQAHGAQLVDAEAWVRGRLSDDEWMAITTPGAHLDASGYRLMAEAVWARLDDAGVWAK